MLCFHFVGPVHIIISLSFDWLFSGKNGAAWTVQSLSLSLGAVREGTADARIQLKFRFCLAGQRTNWGPHWQLIVATARHRKVNKINQLSLRPGPPAPVTTALRVSVRHRTVAPKARPMEWRRINSYFTDSAIFHAAGRAERM